MDPDSLASELAHAYATRTSISSPSSRDGAFDLNAAYATENALVRMRRADGHNAVGLKVGFANKAVWRVMKLDTLVWAHMYDDTVRFAADGEARLVLERMFAPKIEPEVVFKLARPVSVGDDGAPVDAATALASVEWMAIGYEIIDCVFPDWKFQPVDFVAAYGLHAALVVGTPLSVTSDIIPTLVEQLPKFTVRLLKNGETVAEGSGRNSLRSPALCLAELAAAVTRRADAGRLGVGDLVSSGTLTESQPIAAGETWRADVEGIGLTPLTLTVA